MFADFVAANECRPGVVAMGISNADVDGVARTLADPAVLISSSDAGAHMQMLCASGDTTLLLTRHVRERGDFTLERAVHELTGRQAEVFGFHGRGTIAPGNVADLAGKCVAVPETCSKQGPPICGCNDMTYANECELLKAGARPAKKGNCGGGTGPKTDPGMSSNTH